MKKILCLLLIVCSFSSLAYERILDFHSDITVLADGSMQVIETIQVEVEGDAIKRGIFRELPTDYRNALNMRVRIPIKVTQVLRDGENENYTIERLDNGTRIYIGEADYYLAPAIYEYQISYRTDRQLGFFTDHDELYWNVTGNDWNFTINHASATVHLPDTITGSDITTIAYTGFTGETGQDYRTDPLDSGAFFETTHNISPAQGFTIVVGWPKGHVTEPGILEKTQNFVLDNLGFVLPVVGILVLTLYYLYTWIRVGRDPEAGVIVPLYEPPEGFSAASIRYVRNMKYDDKTFTTAIVGLAAKGYLTITESDSEFIAMKTDTGKSDLGPGEKILLDHIFRNYEGISFTQDQYDRISQAIKAHRSALALNYGKQFFLLNQHFIKPGIIISITSMLTALFFNSAKDELIIQFFGTVFIAAFGSIAIALIINVIKSLKNTGSGQSLSSRLGDNTFVLVFILIVIIPTIGLMAIYFPFNLLILLALMTINITFYHLLKAPTHAGRALLDKIEGFRNYLDIAEADELRLAGAPEKTLQLYENFLPYAMALDLEQTWSERFTAQFSESKQIANDYLPTWYSSHGTDTIDNQGFSNNFTQNLTTAISSSSTPPGSGSGGSGSISGGFSGGGGGGGGGGGW